MVLVWFTGYEADLDHEPDADERDQPDQHEPAGTATVVQALDGSGERTEETGNVRGGGEAHQRDRGRPGVPGNREQDPSSGT